MAPRRFADVALPLPVDTLFTYAVPASLADRAAPGMRALVPIQRRVETGYLVRLRDDCPVENPKSIVDFPDISPTFSPAMLDLCAWIAEYYCCSLGEALQCAAPAGSHARSTSVYTLALEALSGGRYSDKQRAIIAALHKHGPLNERQLAKASGATALSATLQALVRRGILIAESTVAESGVSIRTETWAVLVEDRIPSTADIAALQRRAPKQAAVYLALLHGETEQPATSLYDTYGADAAVLRALEAKGLIRREEREIYRLPGGAASGESAPHRLNDEQRFALDEINSAVDAHRYETFLLHGITGSGKTEVYLQAIQHVLDFGKDAIVLVPEISLTPQTVGRFKARFDARIAVLHSGLSSGERYDEWRRALRGEVNIVVGARSAVFAPLPNLGMIIVDEEHDTSYKQTETPRYHARDVAIMRAQNAKAVCVLGSATPSIEAYHNSQREKSTRLELMKRATNAGLPEVQIVDMRIEAREVGGEAVLSRVLEQAVRDRIARSEQVVLLLNRRGHSPFVLCPQCGWVAQCNDCQVSMTYHSKSARLSCHYCNARRAVPQVCDECHFNPLIFLGTGTQKIEDYLMRTFADARIQRMDADTTSGKGGHAKILGRFAEGGIDILVGTQMIAKGHDYPGVTLVGVVNADTGLSIPDFRAAESSFQLLTQVAGRAGRGDKPGTVIVQSYRPKHFAVLAAAQHDYWAFYAREIELREQAGYPPFRRMLHFVIESEDPLEAERATAILHRVVRGQIETLGFHGIELLGPAPASVRRVRKKYRWNLGAFSKSPKRLNTLARASRDAFQPLAPKECALKIDLDPYGMF